MHLNCQNYKKTQKCNFQVSFVRENLEESYKKNTFGLTDFVRGHISHANRVELCFVPEFKLSDLEIDFY